MKAVILAGGKGTRLWPLSRENYPKQFVEFINGASLFQLTLKRTLSYFDEKDIIIVTSLNYKFHTLNQIESTKGISARGKRTLEKNVILEPYPKSTAPAVMLAIKSMPGKYLDEVFFVFPSDHIIEPISKFKQALKSAERIAEAGCIVVFGIKPKRPNSGYGHILAGKRISGGFKVKRFVEKPSLARIKNLMKEHAYWNAGIFAFRADIFLEELRYCAPDIFKYSLQDYHSLMKDFSSVPGDSIDYAVMQKTKRACLVEFKARWSDLGSWESVWEYLSKGESNLSIGRAEFFNSEGCFSFSRDKLVSFLGMRDMLVVESSDSILVMKKGESDKVKQLTQYLKKKRIPHIEDSLTVYRPWGYYAILNESSGYKVKEIGVYPKKFVSLQKHKYRSEHWNVVRGKAEVTLGSKKFAVNKNESIFVPKGIKHKIYNPTNKMAVIIEVQIGSYLGEDDIKRYTSY